MDYYERLLWNVRAGTQNDEGMLMYYVPTIAGGWKTFGTQTDSFWCCTGSGVEEYAKLGDTLYFHNDQSMYVNQFVASEVSWPEKRLRLEQETNFPEEARTTLTVHAEKPVDFALRVRAPHWSPGMAISVNGRPEKVTAASDGYVVVERSWKSGDRVEFVFENGHTVIRPVREEGNTFEKYVGRFLPFLLDRRFWIGRVKCGMMKSAPQT